MDIFSASYVNITSAYTFLGETDDYFAEVLCELDTDTLNTVTATCFLVIVFLSVLGNSLVLCFLLRKDIKKGTNLFVICLAISDLLFATTLPFWATEFLNHWIFGDFTCKLVIGIYFLGLYSSVILLTAMTIDRFMIVVLNRPVSPRVRVMCVSGACLAAWVISIGASISDAMNSKVSPMVTVGQFSCTLESSNFEAPEEIVGHIVQVILLFVLPLVIIVFCSSAILWKYLKAATKIQSRTVMAVMSVVMMFFVCWAPYSTLIIVTLIMKLEQCDVQLYVAIEVCSILAYSHCCVNPILHLFSQGFRRYFFRLLRCQSKERRVGRQHSR